MSAERLAIGDLVRCTKCRRWHPTELPASGSETDYATRMLFYRCGNATFYAGQIGTPARDPKMIKSPLELELWRVTKDGQTFSCELRRDSGGWDVLIRSNGEALFSRRCASEEHARYCAAGLKQYEINAGYMDV